MLALGCCPQGVGAIHHAALVERERDGRGNVSRLRGPRNADGFRLRSRSFPPPGSVCAQPRAGRVVHAPDRRRRGARCRRIPGVRRPRRPRSRGLAPVGSDPHRPGPVDRSGADRRILARARGSRHPRGRRAAAPDRAAGQVGPLLRRVEGLGGWLLARRMMGPGSSRMLTERLPNTLGRVVAGSRSPRRTRASASAFRAPGVRQGLCVTRGSQLLQLNQ